MVKKKKKEKKKSRIEWELRSEGGWCNGKHQRVASA